MYICKYENVWIIGCYTLNGLLCVYNECAENTYNN